MINKKVKYKFKGYEIKEYKNGGNDNGFYIATHYAITKNGGIIIAEGRNKEETIKKAEAYIKRKGY